MSVELASRRTQLARALELPVPRDALELVRLPVPAALPERLLSVLRDDAERVLWCSPGDGDAWAGWGACAWVEGRGEDWPGEIVSQANRLLHDCRVRDLAPGETRAGEPRLFGGIAFDVAGARPLRPAAQDDDRWIGFGACRFLLPRWTYRTEGQRATLTYARRAADSDIERALDEFDAILSTLADARVSEELPAIATREEMNPFTWQRLVASAQQAIASGAFHKLVVARATRLVFTAPVPPHAVAARLRAPGASDHRFAFAPGAGAGTLVGASPERLLRRTDLALWLDPMAGSALLPDGASASEIRAATVELLASGKNRVEHDAVIDALRDALDPLCAAIHIEPTPGVRVLPHLLHLHTPMRGTLRERLHVLELLARIHPTPAVGGTPREQAVAWLRAHEPAPRGWYAGAVGWFDARGDGDFALAIRSALLRGREAVVYAGAGIVAGSDANAEYEETAAKQAMLLRTLGALGAPRA